MLQNLLYFDKKKTLIFFFVFHFEQLSFFTFMPWSISSKTRVIISEIVSKAAQNEKKVTNFVLDENP